MNTARNFSISALFVSTVLIVAGPARADYVALPTTMDKLTPLGNYTSVGDKTFTFLNYTSSALASNLVSVTALSGNSSNPVTPYGFQLSGSFSASGVNATSDTSVNFSVVSSGGLITAVNLFANGTMQGSGVATVSESVFTLAANGGQGTFLGQINVYGSNSATLSLGSGYAGLYITKDIDSYTGATGGSANTSIVQQTFTQSPPSVPEPASIAMMGLGLVSTYLFVRSRRRNVIA